MGFRHAHLILFDDDQLLEPRHVISLAHHDVSVYSGGNNTPEGELWIKRNAICLSRKTDAGEISVDGTPSKPFYLFSENCSDKEDFYFALLRNQERVPGKKDNPPVPLVYNVGDLIGLVQRLHSSEEFLQTRWINALLGRLFLAMYKTSEVENFIRAKITKKIARVKTPSFLSGIVLRNVDMGQGAPYITNPRLRDLTVDGECIVEADIKYTGNAKVEVAATARIELGSRFKARTVDLVLAAVLKRIEGRLLIRIKPPPSNRLWISFETMPKIDLDISPIVSSRQITYNLILRQIESRIKEVIAETIVLPNWDDSPFHDTEHKRWRGGIWADGNQMAQPPDIEEAAAEHGDVDEVEHIEGEEPEGLDTSGPTDRSMSIPVVDASTPASTFSRKASKSAFNLGTGKISGLASDLKSAGSSSSIETRSTMSEKPRAMRAASFASLSSPVVGTDVTNADAIKNSRPAEQNDAASVMAAISARSVTNSPIATPVGSPSRGSILNEESESLSSISSGRSKRSDSKGSGNDLTPQPSVSVAEHGSGSSSNPNSCPATPASSNVEFSRSEAGRSFGADSRQSTASSSSSKSTSTQAEKRLSLAAMTSAAASARKWGLNALQRHTDKTASSESVADKSEGTSERGPMGRGRPLPPPGMPLPFPDKKTKTAPIMVPKRKSVAPPPSLPGRGTSETNVAAVKAAQAAQAAQAPYTEDKGSHKPPPLPRRRQHASGESEGDGMLVVAAPPDSEPTTPTKERDIDDDDYLHHWGVEDVPESESVPDSSSVPEPPEVEEELAPRRPRRYSGRGGFAGSPDGDEDEVGSWMGELEREARAKSMWVDEDGGHH
jgi:hypothetical protein